MTVIFQDRGKQYKAKVGDFIKLPKMSTVKKNDTIVLNDISDGVVDFSMGGPYPLRFR